MAQAKLKEVYKVEVVHKAFYTGGNIEWTSDGKYLLCQCGGSIQVVDVDQGSVISVVGQEKIEEEEEGDTINTFTASKNSDTVVSAHRSGLLKEWTWKDKRLVKQWRNIHKGPVAQLALSEDCTLLATGGSDSSVRIWNLIYHACTHNLLGVQGVVSVLRFHEVNKSRHVYAAAGDTTIKGWDLSTGNVVVTLGGHYSNITDIAFHQDNKHLVSCARDKVAIVWDLEQQIQLRTLPAYETLESLEILEDVTFLPGDIKPDRNSIYVAVIGENGVITIWDGTSGKKLHTQSNSLVSRATDGGLVITNLLYNKTKCQLAIVSADHNIIIHDVATLACVKQFIGFSDEILDIVYLGPKESYIAVATNSPDIKLYNTENMGCQLLQGHTDLVLTLATTSANPCLLVSGAKDNSIRVWMLSNEKATCVAVGTRHTASVITACFSSTGARFILSASSDTTLKLWDIPKKFDSDEVETLNSRLTAIAHEKDVNSVCISPNDKFIATGSLDKTAKLWDPDTLSLLGVFRGHRRGIWHVTFSPVDQVLLSASADCTIKLWALSDLSCVKTLEGHDSSVMCAKFLSRGVQIISAGGDGLLKLWNIKTSECMKTFEHHEEKVWALVVSGNEERIITGGVDSCLIIWKDVTEETRTEVAKAKHEQMLQEQELANLMHSDQLLPALKLALTLERPVATLKIVESLIKQDNTSLSTTIKQLREDQKQVLLKFATHWNSNSRQCQAAQMIISVLLDCVSDGTLRIPQLTLEILLPYTERHFKRMTQLLQDLHFLQYTAAIMQPHGT